MSKEVTYYKRYRSSFDRKNDINPIGVIAIISDTFRRVGKDYTLGSFKNWKHDMLCHISKTSVALSYISGYEVNHNCKQISPEEVNSQLLIDAVKNL